MKINTSRNAGFTLVEIMIVVAIIGLLVAIAIPNFVKARNTSQTDACLNNLRQIDNAVQQWALEHGAADTTVPVEGEIIQYIKGSALPICPASGVYGLPLTVVATGTNGSVCTIHGALPPF